MHQIASRSATFLPEKGECLSFWNRWRTGDTEQVEILYAFLTLTWFITLAVFGKELFEANPSFRVMKGIARAEYWTALSFFILILRSYGLIKKCLRCRKIAAFVGLYFWFVVSTSLTLGGAVVVPSLVSLLAAFNGDVFYKLTKRK